MFTLAPSTRLATAWQEALAVASASTMTEAELTDYVTDLAASKS